MKIEVEVSVEMNRVLSAGRVLVVSLFTIARRCYIRIVSVVILRRELVTLYRSSLIFQMHIPVVYIIHDHA